MAKWKFRGDLSGESRDKVDIVQAQQVIKGNKMTQIQTLDFIIKNYK